MPAVPTYRSTRAVEALRWTNTAADRERFAAWFAAHAAVFETRGPEIVLPDRATDPGVIGEWVLYCAGTFAAVAAETFATTYEAITP